ncbi:MAG: DUF1294 domain-containing protein [Muribaculaceae bacterium]|jgi:uncharacterized membrane protein YsdA (DUF1294 family)|nr:DUF1294 domain-containing protein [Muribaculaceae bacterium]MEE1338794.1 DUF1294 domain-containing protein [Muribaculaceae bacterium]
MATNILIYLAIINLCAFVAFGIDKLKARRGAWRTPESTLLLLAAIGGSFGSFLGMKVWRHKTQHKKFTILVPLLMAIHIAIISYFCL